MLCLSQSGAAEVLKARLYSAAFSFGFSRMPEVIRHRDGEVEPGVISLTLAALGSVCECVLRTVPDMARNFYSISVVPGHAGNLVGPYFAVHGRDGIAEGQRRFWIPCSGAGLKLSRFGEVMGPKNDD